MQRQPFRTLPMRVMGASLVAVLVLLQSGSTTMVDAKAILGVDLGALFMKVALVQRGAPLEIVTNMHSKRKTEQMVLFDAGARFYGADASSLLARKPLQTPVQMTLQLGRDDEHPVVKTLKERHFPVVPTYNETRKGLSIAVGAKAETAETYTPEELVAMVLSHSRDMTLAYMGELGKDVQTAPRDCVLTVPSFYTVHERRALLDAASLAELNVLGLIEENTAAALHYAMDKQFPEDQIFLFYNMGGTAVQVSLVKFHNYNMTAPGSSKPKTVGALEVLSKAWDSTVGGQSFDHAIVEYLADTFNEQWDAQRNDKKKKDVRAIPRAMTKLRLQANKVKHVLSANMEFPIFMDSLHDDCALNTKLTREKLEELSVALIERAGKPITQALAYANMTIDDVDGIELIGGGMRIPRIQADLKEALGGKDLGMHINADESMALGASFHGANLSTAFRVRHVGLMDVNPFPISITLAEMEESSKGGLFGGKKKKKKEDKDDEDEPWGKHATILKSFGKLGVKKTIAFTHDKDIHCALDYEESDLLPEGTPLPIIRYDISGVEDFAKEMEEKKLGKPKVSLQFQLSESGLTNLIKAEASVEETYTAEEEVEVDDDDEEEEADSEKEAEGDAANATAEEKDEKEEERKLEEEGEEKEDANVTDANATDTNATETNTTADEKPKEKPKKKKKKKKIMQEVEKKRIHKKALTVKTYYVGKVQPYSPELLEESKAKLAALAATDKERIELEAAKNKVEGFVYYIKNKLIDDEDNVNKVSTEEQRAEILKLAEDAEEWMYEGGATADLAATEEKYVELAAPAQKVFTRVEEMTARPAAIKALQGRLSKVGELMTKWETTMTQVTEEERGEVLTKVETVKAWILEQEEAQAKVELHEDAAFLSTDVPGQMKSIEMLVGRFKKKPKPKPPKKNETETNATDANATEADVDDLDGVDAETGESKEEDAAEAGTDETKEDASAESEDKKEEATEETAEEVIGEAAEEAAEGVSSKQEDEL